MSESIEPEFFQTSNLLLHGARVGEGPPVVYLHGITANWAVWQPILEMLASCSTGVAVSQRGHGLSDKPESGYSGADFAADTLALIEHLDMGPAVIVGHSLGARNAVIAGSQRPDLVRGVLSVDFAPNTGRDELRTLAERVAGGDREFESYGAVCDYLQSRYPLMPIDAVERRATHGFASTDEGSLRPIADPSAMRQTAAGLFEPYPEHYRTLSPPLIALRGELSTLVTQAAFDDAAEIRPDAEHVVVTGTDHYIPEENPRLVADYVMALLR